MPEFSYADLLPLGPDDTRHRLLDAGGVRAGAEPLLTIGKAPG